MKYFPIATNVKEASFSRNNRFLLSYHHFLCHPLELDKNGNIFWKFCENKDCIILFFKRQQFICKQRLLHWNEISQYFQNYKCYDTENIRKYL